MEIDYGVYIQCATREWRLFSVSMHNRGGAATEPSLVLSEAESSMQPIAPETLMEVLADDICPRVK